MQIIRKSFNGARLFVLMSIAMNRELASSGVIKVTADLPANTFQLRLQRPRFRLGTVASPESLAHER
jgi:hypothetical protein